MRIHFLYYINFSDIMNTICLKAKAEFKYDIPLYSMS